MSTAERSLSRLMVVCVESIWQHMLTVRSVSILYHILGGRPFCFLVFNFSPQKGFTWSGAESNPCCLAAETTSCLHLGKTQGSSWNLASCQTVMHLNRNVPVFIAKSWHKMFSEILTIHRCQLFQRVRNSGQPLVQTSNFTDLPKLET